MLAVLTSASYDVRILPAFVEHYARLGAEVVFVMVLELTEGLFDETERVGLRCKLPVQCYKAAARWQKSKLEGENKNELRRQVRLTPQDWYVPADLDEFIRFDESLPTLIEKMSTGEFGYAKGTFVDRTTVDGTLTEYNQNIPISEQYPRQSRIGYEVTGMTDTKVVLARGHLAVSSGHHCIVDESYKKYPKDFSIDHYAWRMGRLEALQRRLVNYRALGIKCDGLIRMLDYIEDNEGKVAPCPSTT
jgi:hypothetical protein